VSIVHSKVDTFCCYYICPPSLCLFHSMLGFFRENIFVDDASVLLRGNTCFRWEVCLPQNTKMEYLCDTYVHGVHEQPGEQTKQVKLQKVRFTEVFFIDHARHDDLQEQWNFFQI